jgi:hypothetical protein
LVALPSPQNALPQFLKAAAFFGFNSIAFSHFSMASLNSDLSCLSVANPLSAYPQLLKAVAYFGFNSIAFSHF